VKEIDVPPTTGGWTEALTRGPDDNIWFAQSQPSGDTVMRITPDFTTTTFALSTHTGQLFAMATGPDSNLWLSTGGNVEKFTPPAS
jgi:hypothetical protein